MDKIESNTGFIRLSSILAPRGPIPVWAGVKTGRYPKPVKLGPRITAWRVEDIRALIEKPGARVAIAGDVVPKGERWELCEKVLARNDVKKRLSRGWGERDRADQSMLA